LANKSYTEFSSEIIEEQVPNVRHTLTGAIQVSVDNG